MPFAEASFRMGAVFYAFDADVPGGGANNNGLRTHKKAHTEEHPFPLPVPVVPVTPGAQTYPAAPTPSQQRFTTPEESPPRPLPGPEAHSRHQRDAAPAPKRKKPRPTQQDRGSMERTWTPGASRS